MGVVVLQPVLDPPVNVESTILRLQSRAQSVVALQTAETHHSHLALEAEVG